MIIIKVRQAEFTRHVSYLSLTLKVIYKLPKAVSTP